MDFVNRTAFQAAWTMGFQPDGREILVIAVKGTFRIPSNGDEAVPAEAQMPLTEADEFTGEPGLSATLYESDYAHKKPFCDVLVNGAAYAPGGSPVDQVDVSLSIGSIHKRFRVVGDRVWRSGILSAEPSWPEPFTRMPISYDCAFGGVDRDAGDPERIETFRKNPVGVGYHPLTKGFSLNGKPLPNTEASGSPVKNPKGSYQPMSLGPLGRNFESRIPYAGTYNEEWLKSRAPFFPDDFDYRYFQAAPADQWISYPSGGEQVVLENLTPEGRTMFRLPTLRMPVLFLPYTASEKEVEAVIDTVLIEPDEGRVCLTWRVTLPLQQNCFELRQVIVGEQLRNWRISERASRKPHYKNLAEYIDARRGGRSH
jgi:hypothetical protein